MSMSESTGMDEICEECNGEDTTCGSCAGTPYHDCAHNETTENIEAEIHFLKSLRDKPSVEGIPVSKGDILYWATDTKYAGTKYIVRGSENQDTLFSMTWIPPKPKMKIESKAEILEKEILVLKDKLFNASVREELLAKDSIAAHARIKEMKNVLGGVKQMFESVKPGSEWSHIYNQINTILKC